MAKKGGILIISFVILLDNLKISGICQVYLNKPKEKIIK